MRKRQTVNRLKEYYDFLSTASQRELRDRMMEMLNLSTASFYRRLENPTLFSISDKLSIATIAGMPPHFLFPELENVNS